MNKDIYTIKEIKIKDGFSIKFYKNNKLEFEKMLILGLKDDELRLIKARILKKSWLKGGILK